MWVIDCWGRFWLVGCTWCLNCLSSSFSVGLDVLGVLGVLIVGVCV